MKRDLSAENRVGGVIANDELSIEGVDCTGL
jgi:hypothetical protein